MLYLPLGGAGVNIFPAHLIRCLTQAVKCVGCLHDNSDIHNHMTGIDSLRQMCCGFFLVWSLFDDLCEVPCGAAEGK